MAFVLEKYLQQIRDATSKPGVYAYRGQSRAEWPLHSAATRRLAKSLGHDALNAPGFSKVYIDYHRETLISPARTRGFGVESGRDISDLQLLAKLQHFEAATGLLDFTRSPLIALWFVSRESDSDGKLFVLNVNDPIHVAKVPSDLERQAIDTVFSRADNEPGLLYWEPMWSGDAMPRILRQRGIFIIGRPLIPTDGQFIEAIKVSKNDKAFLLDELALLDISDSSMVADVYGFSSLEGATASTHVSTPQFNLIQGNQHYQAGNYIQAIVAWAASLLSSIRTNGYAENLDKSALESLCQGTGVSLEDVQGKIVVSDEQILPFLEVVDRRRYEIGLVPHTPERYRASSRARVGGAGT